VSDKYGGASVTVGVFAGMMVAVVGVLYFLSLEATTLAFWGFFACFMALFFFTGVGNASTFQMIPPIMDREVPRLMPQLEQAEAKRQAGIESGAIIAFTSAIAAYGAFFIPKSFGTSIATTGGPDAALWGFLVFYAACLAVTWGIYARKGGLLYDVERQRRMAARPVAATAAE
jgi:NNP family nitrate/nitrite transporter-like MFS transporter